MNDRPIMSLQLAKAMHQRFLTTWASEALRIRKAGLDVPGQAARRLRMRPGERRPLTGNGAIAQIHPDDAQERAA